MVFKYFNNPLSPRINSWAKGRFIALALLFVMAACQSQNDGDVLFSDTERDIIKTLVYAEPAADATNSYESNAAAAALGQKFFWDTQFSGAIVIQGNRTAAFAADTTKTKLINCVACHDPNFGWADSNSRPNNISLGANFTERNSPTVLNSSQSTFQLWDGATDSVWAVARPAVEGNPHNFGRVGVAFIICQNSTYKAAYEAIFGTTNTNAICGTINATYCAGASCVPTNGNNWSRSLYTGAVITDNHVDTIFANFGKAIAAYEKRIVSKNSAFDRWVAGSESAMTVSQKRGLKIFVGKGNCIRCHSGPNFSDGKFHNLGVPQTDLSGTGFDEGRSTGITRVTSTATSSNGFFGTATGRYTEGAASRVTGLTASSADTGAFKTPTLRSVNKTPPYFHNGIMSNLWDVVNFYNFAGNAGTFPGTKDSILTTRKMTNEELEDLVNFLKALEGEALAASLTASPGGFGSTTGW